MLTIDPTGAMIVIGILFFIIVVAIYLDMTDTRDAENQKVAKKIPSSYTSYPIKFEFKYKHE